MKEHTFLKRDVGTHEPKKQTCMARSSLRRSCATQLVRELHPVEVGRTIIETNVCHMDERNLQVFPLVGTIAGTWAATCDTQPILTARP